MKRISLWMWAAILMCGLGMSLTSCSDNDDENDGKGNNNSGTSEYKIEIGPGLTMNENKFETKVPATTDCDSKVIAALQAIEKITDVKAFKMVNGVDYETNKNITKTAYYFNYKQDIDHNNPNKGWFKQQCVLTVAGKDNPTVLQTEGYALGGAEPEKNYNRIDSIREPALVSILNANCLQVEHRYQGWSLPEGWTNKWNYLSAKQQSDDLHAIVEDIKGSGIISTSSKWLATGVSKNGETCAYYAYHYPTDMNAYVPFCAPFMTTLEDMRTGTYMISKEALGDKYDAVKAAFRNFCSNTTLQDQVADIFIKNNPSMAANAANKEGMRSMMIYYLFSNQFQKMSYVHYTYWLPMVPKEGDSAETYYKYIMANGISGYENESEQEYEDRQDSYNDLYNDGIIEMMDDLLKPHAHTRAAAASRFDPYMIQCCKELGYPATDFSWVSDLLSNNMKEELINKLNPSAYSVSYDSGSFIKEFLAGMKNCNSNILFVYGMQDPWTGSRIPDNCLGANSKIMYISNGTHNDYIWYWTESEKTEIGQWLSKVGF